MSRICVVGSVNVDLTFRTPRLPRPGETLTGQGFHLGFGGKGANQAVMAARLGAEVSLIARVGNDAFGREACDHFQKEGINTSCVRVDDDHSTGVAGIVVDDRADNCILVIPGANHALSCQDVRESAAAIESAQVLLCQLEVPLATTGEALALARSAGVRTILNPAPVTCLSREILQLADICIPNETEIEILTGKPTGTVDEVAAAARALQEMGAATVIVTLGSRGALLVEAGEVCLLPAVSIKAVDPTGAGDAFVGSLAVFLTEGMPLRAAAHKANGVAALTVTRQGAQSAMPYRREIEP